MLAIPFNTLFGRHKIDIILDESLWIEFVLQGKLTEKCTNDSEILVWLRIRMERITSVSYNQIVHHKTAHNIFVRTVAMTEIIALASAQFCKVTYLMKYYLCLPQFIWEIEKMFHGKFLSLMETRVAPNKICSYSPVDYWIECWVLNYKQVSVLFMWYSRLVS